jgi:anion-transporting  ArsA/GET3 family ATPase
VLDGPASGQLIALLGAPSTFRGIARVGPVARQTADIEALLADHRLTGAVIVTTAEQMAVSEVLGLQADLEGQAVDLDAVVINRLVSSPFTSAQDKLLGESGEDPALWSARWFSDRARVQRQQVRRLERTLQTDTHVRLPFMFGGVDRAAINELAARLRKAMA